MIAKVLAIVVTYNGKDWVDYCLGSLVDSTPAVDIICIDNDSIDGTQAIVAERYPNVQLVSLENNLGFGKGNNIGLEKCLSENYDYAFLLNQDARVEPDTITKLISVHQKNPEYGVLSPIHRSYENDFLDSTFTSYLRADFTPSYLSDVILGGKLAEVYSTRFVNAALWLISKDCLLKVGLFDKVFTHYGEDDDYLDRVHSAGLKVGIVPDAFANHARDRVVGSTHAIGSAKFKSLVNRDYVKLLLRYKRFQAGKLTKLLFFIREMISEFFYHALMLDSKKLWKTLVIYARLLKSTFQ
ncbi:MAG: glycosyltransferase family 2 protein [Gammaproteobacteria bacterium]|nr:glycosyltransferase family 2 protein [Gammaproteobacteria bacterium]